MKKLFSCICLVLLFGCFSCSRDNNTQYESVPVVESDNQVLGVSSKAKYQVFMAKLPIMPLPFTAKCGFKYDEAKTPDSTTVGKYVKEFEKVYKKIQVSPNVEAILAIYPTDDLLPRLRTFDHQGAVLDEQDLKFNPCGEEPGFQHSEQLTIQKDLTIVVLDSTARWQFDAAYQEIPKTRKLTVTKKIFKVLDSGEIIEVK
ncbi:hypothetical protein TH61_08285 [Rufibacter sp. DG15C]|uniref:hypothetical protein n=1 Tax=Rufibacter sp. DG15C TaxID=1379909 RepID=UPI00078E9B6D|nr:hypothetical protein [Rufibacter sp. DG15C]AMM51176.1 hypothetical protein TH61_08285 [Rufibacter sp. DG15C]